KAIAEDLGLPTNTLYIYRRRLRLRFDAYTLARIERFPRTNAQILEAEPYGELRQGASETPYIAEAAVLTIASLARSIPREWTLLWVFTAHVFLHHLIAPHHTTSWIFERYVHELWHWVTEGTFQHVVQQGAKEGSRADKAALAVLQQTPFKQLVEAL